MRNGFGFAWNRFKKKKKEEKNEKMYNICAHLKHTLRISHSKAKEKKNCRIREKESHSKLVSGDYYSKKEEEWRKYASNTNRLTHCRRIFVGGRLPKQWTDWKYNCFWWISRKKASLLLLVFFFFFSLLICQRWTAAAAKTTTTQVK